MPNNNSNKCKCLDCSGTAHFFIIEIRYLILQCFVTTHHYFKINTIFLLNFYVAHKIFKFVHLNT